MVMYVKCDALLQNKFLFSKHNFGIEFYRQINSIHSRIVLMGGNFDILKLLLYM